MTSVVFIAVLVTVVAAAVWDDVRFIYSSATRGFSVTALDESFGRSIAAALRGKLTPDLPASSSAEIADLIEPLLGFRPVAVCQNDGFDWGGIASEQTRKAYDQMNDTAGLPKLGSFHNRGDDAATPDNRITLHFVDKDGAVHARAGFWNRSIECQSGQSQCAPLEDLRLQSGESGTFVFLAPGWRQCLLRFGAFAPAGDRIEPT